MSILGSFSKLFTPGPSTEEKQLLQRCRGDAGQLERLINLELSRRPNQSRAEASSAALDRWSRDS